MNIFTRGYCEAAMWTEDPNPGSGQYQADLRKLPEDFKAQAMRDCDAFMDTGAGDILNGLALDDAGEARAGHDFWLTRNGHGAGFWDGDYPEPAATLLTDIAHSFGEAYLDMDWDGEENSAENDDVFSFDREAIRPEED